eukprot:GDKK01047396.1.p1 GENE.GDKK01047396.1~~GDKK01047396.1.p1  ORF type:complete len:1102 (-),score=256.44 GDKK01047396.1:536-3841(-)
MSARNNAPDVEVPAKGDVEMNSNGEEVPVAREFDEEDYKVGGGIKLKLEDIFARASEAEPIYEDLGRLKGICTTLDIDIEQGVPSSAVEQRLKTFGANKLPDEDPVTFWAILLDAWSDHMILILAAAAIVSLVLGLTVPEHGGEDVDYTTGWIEGVAIIISITLVTSISSINDYRKELKFRELTDANNKLDITVLRDGRHETIDIADIVVGDLININPGLVMPADGLYVKGLSIVIDESSVTGENDPKKKTEELPFYLTGTVVMTAENAWVLVCAVGESSFGGKLLMQSRGSNTVRDTPLQERLDGLADSIGKFGIVAAVILFTTLAIIEGARFARDDPEADGVRFLDYFILAVAIVTVAVPEGLPLAVTISLAYSQNRMRKDNNQVRRLKACETMGNATTICSDKTGTLTQNLMSVVQGQLSGNYFKINNPGEFLEKVVVENLNPDCLRLFCDMIATNSSSVKVVRTKNKEGTPMPPKWMWEVDKGNKTDNALLDLVDRIDLQPNDITDMQSLPHQRIRESLLIDGSYCVFPFTSVTKGMSTVIKGDDGTCMVYHKGGADEVLAKCTFFRDSNGEQQPMTDEAREVIAAKVKEFASHANRNIGVAYQKLNGDLPAENPLTDYVWFGVVGIQDPLRPEVLEAVRKCQHAGVTVRMCTGDNLDTALAISKQCGIYDLDKPQIAMTGRDFRDMVYDSFAMGDDGAARLTPLLFALTVLARSQPLDKQMLVLMHMTRGEVVAVTGDGTNDAPALKLANVGFVMRSGTDIAVKSADIVLLDDNFRSVQRAVVWGRTVNDNIRKFLQLQLSVNVVSVVLTFVSAVSSTKNESVLTTVQLLWVNLIMDTFAALALATEEPSEACLERGPVNRQAPLLSYRMMLGIAFQAAYQLTATLVMQHKGYEWFNVEQDTIEHRTVVFNIFVWCTIFNMFNCRKLYRELNIFEGFTRSYTFLGIMLFTMTFQVIAVEFFRDFINTRPLSWDQWLGCLATGIIVWPVCFVMRLVPLPEPVYSREFDPSEMDDEAKKMLDNLTAQISKVVGSHTAEETANHGKQLEKVERMYKEALARSGAASVKVESPVSSEPVVAPESAPVSEPAQAPAATTSA